MSPSIPLLQSLAMVVAFVGVARAESEISYEDLRIQTGAMCTTGESVSVSLMAGDLGDKDQGVIDFGSDFGFVLGVRGVIGRVAGAVQVRSPGSDISLNLLGGEVLGGFGYFIDKSDIIELLVGYTIGVSSEAGQTALSHRDGRFTGYSGELGWYHTLGRSNLVIGGVVGFERIHNTMTLGSGDAFPVHARGVDAALVLGYRWH